MYFGAKYANNLYNSPASSSWTFNFKIRNIFKNSTVKNKKGILYLSEFAVFVKDSASSFVRNHAASNRIHRITSFSKEFTVVRKFFSP